MHRYGCYYAGRVSYSSTFYMAVLKHLYPSSPGYLVCPMLYCCNPYLFSTFLPSLDLLSF